MKLEHLRYVMAVARCGSMSRAAQELYTTQPYLSKCIKEIESELRITIFIRQNDGVTLTGQGQQFLLHATRLVNEMDDMMRLYEPTESDLAKFSVSTVRSSLVMDCFLQFVSEHQGNPRIKFHIREGGNLMAVNDVYTQTSSIGVVQLHSAERKEFLSRLKSKNIQYQRIRPLERQVILSKDHPLLRLGRDIVTEDLYSYGLVRYGKGLLFGSTSADDLWYNTFFDPDRITKQICVYDRASLHNILTQTDYFTVGTDPSLRQEEVHKIVSVRLADNSHAHSPAAEMGYIYLATGPFSPLTEDFVRLLMDSYS